MTPLGQIGKRLQIIKIAISLTDDEAINQQRSKLRLHKNDKQLDNILSVLDDENYAQASNLIDRYIRGPYDDKNMPQTKTGAPVPSAADILAKQKEAMRIKEEEELIKKFGLFMDQARKNEPYNPINEEEMFLMAESSARESEVLKESQEQPPAPAPRKPNTEEIMARYAMTEKELPSKKEREPIVFAPIIEPSEAESKSPYKEKDFAIAIDEISPSDAHEIVDEMLPLPPKEEMPDTHSNIEEALQDIAKKPQNSVVEAIKPMEYAPISYIDQKIRNMLNQYPQVEPTSERSEDEERLLYMISLEGYTETDIEKTVDEVYKLKAEGKLGEAAHLLLIAAATESLYAQFTLARELYKGDILQRDLPEAFTQINRLAMNDYPEAVCDLAQFYEYGIGISKDKKKAYNLYQDALELGVKRADTHLSRMEESSKGILGKLFGR